MIGAETLSKSTLISDTVDGSVPVASKFPDTSWAGPRFVPKIVINSPGATGPGAKLAALVTPVITGCPCETLTVTGIRTGWPPLAGVTTTDPWDVPCVKPASATRTVRLPGAFPVPGSTESQEP